MMYDVWLRCVALLLLHPPTPFLGGIISVPGCAVCNTLIGKGTALHSGVPYIKLSIYPNPYVLSFHWDKAVCRAAYQG